MKTPEEIKDCKIHQFVLWSEFEPPDEPDEFGGIRVELVCDVCEKVLTGDEIVRHIKELERSVDAWESYKQSIDEALNSGDGSYRP